LPVGVSGGEYDFREERLEVEQTSKLGPLLQDDYRDARRIFLEDMAAR